jgi:N-methylhydantoinase A/oxoprolinase/acetone carboxylase beta subunit
MRRIGIDVGGTNTDAVLIEDGHVAAAVKAPTTDDVTSGILEALSRLAGRASLRSPPVDGVMIGTTHFVNAVVQRRHLNKVAALRLAMPACASLPPFCDWPDDLAGAVAGGVWMVEGGHDYDGRPFMPLDREAVARAAREMRGKGLGSVAVSAIFSPLDSSHERAAAAIVASELPGASITCSSDLGRIGLLERENAGLLNAALADLAATTIGAFERAMGDCGLQAPLYITQNDGTIAGAAQALKLPVYSFACGATNSMRGGAYLSGLADAMVIDVGGTTTDVGQLRHGFPREANSVVGIGGVRTLFRMPDLISIGLGGGSHVARDPLAVGPLSLGHRLLEEGLCFGGRQLTTTDVAVAAGLLALGDRRRVAHLDAAFCARVLAAARAIIEEAVDRMKTEAGDVPLIAVGGGAFLVPERLAGVAHVVRVTHGDCANAVGAAIAKVSGECDQIFRNVTRAAALAAAGAIAADRAAAAGADRATLATIESEDMPIAYLPGNALRVRVRVAGEVAAGGGAPEERPPASAAHRSSAAGR